MILSLLFTRHSLIERMAGKNKIKYNKNNKISQQRLHGSTPNIMCVGTMSADVPPVVPIGPWGAGGGGVKN